LKNKQGHTPISEAIARGQTNVARLLASVADKSGNTALGLAAAEGHVELLRGLVDGETLLNKCNKTGWTPLMLAASQGRVEAVQILLDARAQPDLPDRNGNAALTCAAARGHADVLRSLLGAKASLNNMNKQGKTAFDIALTKGHMEAILTLADVPDEHGNTAVARAVLKDDEKLLAVLLKANASCFTANHEDEIPLTLALQRGNESIIKLLIDVSDKAGNTALAEACRRGDVDRIQRLLEVKACVDAKNKSSGNPLLLALQNGHFEVAGMLIDAISASEGSSDIDVVSLITAVRVNRADLVYRIIATKAHVNAQDADGKTPLHHALASKSLESMNALLEAQADVNVRDNAGCTPLALASSNGDLDALKTLINGDARCFESLDQRESLIGYSK